MATRMIMAMGGQVTGSTPSRRYRAPGTTPIPLQVQMGPLVGHALNVGGRGVQQLVCQVRKGAGHGNLRTDLRDSLIGRVEACPAATCQLLVTVHPQAPLTLRLTAGLADPQPPRPGTTNAHAHDQPPPITPTPPLIP